MEMKAILLVGASGPDGSYSERERIAGVPLALMPVLGTALIDHVARRLEKGGVNGITVISDTGSEATSFENDRESFEQGLPQLRWLHASGDDLWRTAGVTFAEYSQGGAELVLVMRLGAYCDFDLDAIIHRHLRERARITRVNSKEGAVQMFLVSGSRREDAAQLFRGHLGESGLSFTDYEQTGYVNPLRTPHDLRQLATDGLMQRAGLTPNGVEVKPGVWVSSTAKVHRQARVLAPAYIGPRAKVRAAVVVTRCSSIEHHSEVDCGTVVEDCTLLPYSYLGAGLDTAHSVVGFQRVMNLKRNVVVEISDPKLVGSVSTHVLLRAVAGLAGLAGFLPRQVALGFAGKTAVSPVCEMPSAVETPLNKRYETAAATQPMSAQRF